MHNLLRRNFGITHFKEHSPRRKNKRVLLREFDLPLSEEKRDLLAEREKTGTRLNGIHRDIKLVYGKKTVKVYAV